MLATHNAAMSGVCVDLSVGRSFGFVWRGVLRRTLIPFCAFCVLIFIMYPILNEWRNERYLFITTHLYAFDVYKIYIYMYVAHARDHAIMATQSKIEYLSHCVLYARLLVSLSSPSSGVAVLALSPWSIAFRCCNGVLIPRRGHTAIAMARAFRVCLYPFWCVHTIAIIVQCATSKQDECIRKGLETTTGGMTKQQQQQHMPCDMFIKCNCKTSPLMMIVKYWTSF